MAEKSRGCRSAPAGVEAGRRLPLITYLHGGPGGGFQRGFSPQVRQSVQMEYRPVRCWPGEVMRSSAPTRGEVMVMGKPSARQRNNWGEGDLEDVLSGIDHLIGLGLADPDRLGLIGHLLRGLSYPPRPHAGPNGSRRPRWEQPLPTSIACTVRPICRACFVEYFGNVPWKARVRYEDILPSSRRAGHRHSHPVPALRDRPACPLDAEPAGP